MQFSVYRTDVSLLTVFARVHALLEEPALHRVAGQSERCPEVSARDAFVFGGAARLRYHGVTRIVPGTAPPELGLAGRFNLTLRRY
jgi:hypothetical protein